MRKIKGKVADNIILIKDHKIRNGCGSAPVSDLFSYHYGITGDNSSKYRYPCEVLIDYPKIGGEDTKKYYRKLGNFYMQTLMSVV